MSGSPRPSWCWAGRCCCRLGRGLDALTLGEDAAAAHGHPAGAAAPDSWSLGIAACVGAATAVAGAIGFVGLVVPHLLRPLVGARPSVAALPPRPLAARRWCWLADIAVRLILPERDLKLGVLMAHGRRAPVPAPDLQDAEGRAMTLLSLENLTVRAAIARWSMRVSLTIGAGELVGLIGPNGAGKTTLMRGALGPVAACGRILADAPCRRRPAPAHVAWLPQSREIAWPVTVETLVDAGPHAASGRRSARRPTPTAPPWTARCDHGPGRLPHTAPRPTCRAANRPAS